MTNPNTLEFVQIINDVASIDSRVYCRDIIQVDHGDWMSNVIKKWQSLIEQRFGQLRFENGYVNIPSTIGFLLLYAVFRLNYFGT